MSPVSAPTALERMLDELEAGQLVVVLVPLNPKLRGWNEFGMKRVTASVNAAWYRKFCASNISKRGVRRGKFDTCIKRFRTIDALKKMITGQPSTYHHDELVRIASKFK